MDVAHGSELEMQADKEEEEREGRESALSTERFSNGKQEWQTGEAAWR